MTRFKNLKRESNILISASSNDKFRLYVQVPLVCLLIIVTWILLSLPIIFYHIPKSVISSNTSGNTGASGNDSVCSAPVQYTTTRGICLTEFANILQSFNCSPDPMENILVVRNEEARVTGLINGLTAIGASAECLSKAVPFLCLHLFGLCGGSEDSIQPTSSQCEEITNRVCQQQWMLIQRLDIDLPDCSMFPAEASSCPAVNNSLISINETVTGNMPEIQPNGTMLTVLECNQDFYREDNSSVCLPSCYTWTQFNRGVSILTDVVVFISAFIGFLAAIAVIIISCLARKRMLIFPSIFIVYMDIGHLIVAVFLMVNYMGRRWLFCSSKNLLEILDKGTPFCTVSGIIATYVTCQTALWWLFHIATLFWKIIFPLHARAFEAAGKNKYIHITCAIVGLSLPLVPIITIMAKFAVDLHKQNKGSTYQNRARLFFTGGLGFLPTRYPPLLCFGRDGGIIFYCIVLSYIVILGLGLSLLIIMIYSVHRQHARINKTKHQFTFGTAEKKLLIVFCYYVIAGTISLTGFTLSTTNIPNVIRDFGNYFICEQEGHNATNPCSRSAIENISHTTMETLSFILLIFVPVVNLVFAANVQELKKLWRKRPWSTWTTHS